MDRITVVFCALLIDPSDGDPSSQRELGAHRIRLMRVAQSPGLHGYDITGGCHVDHDYGTWKDYKRPVAAADSTPTRRRGLR